MVFSPFCRIHCVGRYYWFLNGYVNKKYQWHLLIFNAVISNSWNHYLPNQYWEALSFCFLQFNQKYQFQASDKCFLRCLFVASLLFETADKSKCSQSSTLIQKVADDENVSLSGCFCYSTSCIRWIHCWWTNINAVFCYLLILLGFLLYNLFMQSKMLVSLAFTQIFFVIIMNATIVAH